MNWEATKHKLTTTTSSIKTQTTAQQQFDCLLQHNKMSDFYVTVNAGDYCNEARLGNKMFMVAAAISIACRNNASLILLEGKSQKFLYLTHSSTCVKNNEMEL